MYQPILQHIARYITLQPAEEQLLVSLLGHRRLRRRQYLLQEGEVCRYEYFVLKGCLRAYTVDAGGQEHILQFAVEGWWIGDMHSFQSGRPSALQIDALEDAELLMIDRDSLERLYREAPAFERYFRLIIQNAWISLQQRMLSAMAKPAAERYKDFLQQYPNIEQRVPDRLVAAYLGIKPQSLSRIRGRAARKQ